MAMSVATRKRYLSLLPLFVVLGFTVTGSLAYGLRVAMKNPELSWNRRKNPEPWNEYRNKNYKLFSITGAQDNLVSQAPKY